jgi:asparagine synthase (glutamine-hydrolysing)
MCGICGLYDMAHGAPASRELIRAMMDIQCHRGPDGEGEYYDDSAGIGLGHRRLSIIDLATGDQPMCNEDGGLWVVFNGEIYNYRELRPSLEARGHIFRTASDTEVILHAYEEYGDQCPAHLNGIFAFAIWDARRRRLFLARDPFGVKPLYHACVGGVFRFASEQKAILADPGFPRAIDLDSVHLTLTFRFCPAPRTLFRDVRKLPPGGFLSVEQDAIREGRYAPAVAPIDRATDRRTWIEALRTAYDRAVERQMVSDVPIGLSLSGGVDSNALLALMSAHAQAPVRAFTVSFAGREDTDELQPAHEIAARFGAAFAHQRITEEDYAAFAEQYIWHMEEPIVNQSAPAYYFVARMARDAGVKVLLNGQGPDEAFGGYPRHLAAAHLGRLWRAGLGRLMRWLARAGDGLLISEASRRVLYAAGARDEADVMLRIYAVAPAETCLALFAPEVRAQVDADLPRRWVREQLVQAPEGSLLEKMLFIDARSGLSEELLISEDKMGMAAGVEARVPYLDVEVMALAERMPGNLKIRGLAQKVAHKEACAAWLPDSVVWRRKIGFTSAADRWFRGEAGARFEGQIGTPGALTGSLLNPPHVRELLRQHRSGARDHQRILFLLRSLEDWHRVFCLRAPLSLQPAAD